MKKYWGIFLILLVLPLSAKDPMGRGKSAFQPGRAYPQVDISGFEELEFNSLDQSGEPEKYQNTSEYLNLPVSVRVYDGLRHRRLIDLEGQINEKLYVRYKIEQDPDFPQETDIYVEYDKFSVYFGKYDAYLTNGSLFSMGKSIDGLYMDYLDKNFEIEGIYGEERSHQRDFAFSGTGQREYSLGQTNIQEGTLKVYLNGEALSESAYRVNYFDGKIIFDNILSVLDRVHGTYEYLDPIEDFLPISSKVRLSGLQHRYQTYRGVEPRIITSSATYQYSPETRLDVVSPVDKYEKLTNFQYQDRILTVTVRDPSLKGVYIYLGEFERIPLRLNEDNIWIGEFPGIAGMTEKSEIVIEYETEEQNIGLVYHLLITENTIEEISSPYYIIMLPEGIVFFEQGIFRQNTKMRLGFEPHGVNQPEQIRVNFKNDTQVLVKQNRDKYNDDDQYLLERMLSDEDSIGENNCYLILDYGAGSERVYKIPYTVDYPAAAGQDLTRIQLTEYPLLSFSEKIYFAGELLELNQDYRMNYTTGVVTFLRSIPADAGDLYIEYVHNQTRAVQEILKGNETQGPYKLANTLIVPESVAILVNNLSMLEGADYKLDAANGQISFTRKIKSIDTIQIDYKYYVSITPAADQRKEQFSISSFYVQEQAKSAEGESTNAYALSGSDPDLRVTYDAVTDTTQIRISVKYLPIVANSLTIIFDDSSEPTQSISEYNGEILVSGDYTVLRNFKITFDQGATAIAPKVYFSGNNSTTVILDEMVSNLPRPIVYESMVLEVKTKNSPFYIPLVYKRDYIIGYREDLDDTPGARDSDGNAILRNENLEAWQRGIITFITGNINTGYTVYSGFAAEDQFRLTYKISNAETTDPGDVLHQTYGTKFTYSPLDWLRTDVEYNESQKQYQRSLASASYSGTGNASSQQEIQLSVLGVDALEVVEDSERVYINDRLQTKNDQYSISYKGGLVRFRAGMILQPEDRIYIEFQYYSSGLGEEEMIIERAKAAKVDATVRLGNTDISAGYVTVDAKYDPVGNPAALYPAGTEAKNVIINSRPIDRLQLYSRVEQYETLLGNYYDDETQSRYQDTTYQNYKVSYGFNQNDSVALAYNRTDVKQPGSTTELSGLNNRQQDYQMDLNFGPDNIRSGVFMRNAESFVDNFDVDEYSSKVFNRNIKLTNFLRPLKDLSFSSSFIRNTDDQFQTVRTMSQSDAYTELVRYNPWTLDTSLEYSGADYTNMYDIDDPDETTRSTGRDRRQVFNFNFRRPPELKSALWEELYLHYDDTYSHRTTDLYKQAPDVSRQNNFNAALRPYDIVSLGFEDRYSTNLMEDRNRRDLYQENVYRLSRIYVTKYISIVPADFFIVNKIEFSRKANENGRSVQSGSTERTYALDNYDTLLQSYTLNPLANLSMTLDFDSRNVERFSEVLYTTGYSYSESLEPESTQAVNLRYTLAELWGISNIAYNWQLNASQRRISRLNVDQVGTRNYTKDDLDSGANKMTLAYNYLNSFTNSHSLDTLEEYKRKTDEGTRYSYGQTDWLNVRYAIPFTGIGLTYGFTRVYNNQFRYLSGIIKKDSLTKDTYNEKLLRFDDTQQYKIDYTMFPQLTLDGSLYFRRIEQEIQVGRMTTANIKSRGEINTKAYELGITYRPIMELNLRYGWRQNIFDAGYGEESRFTADYKPLQFSLGEINYKFENIFTYGKGTNDPEQNDSLNSLNGFVQTSVVDRNDIKVINTLIFRVNQDISNVIIDNLIIDINLTRLHFWDRVNEEFSYSLNAFYAKGTINF